MTAAPHAGRDDGTRARVLDAAATILAKDPSSTVAVVAAAAGVSRATVHRHFRTRAELLAALDVEPDPGTRERVLAAAAQLVSERGLATLSMDDVAAAAGVSRASAYRLFPGKAALVEALLLAYTPFEPIEEMLERVGDRPPEEVVPLLYRAAAGIAAANVGILRAVFFEITSGTPEAVEGAGQPLHGMLEALGGYFARQMAAGRLVRMHPTLAVQAVLGPLVFHLFTRSQAEVLAGLRVPLDEVVEQLGSVALRGLQPASGPAGTTAQELQP